MHTKPQHPKIVRLSEYAPPAFTVEESRLAFQLGFDSTTVTATHLIQKTPGAPNTIELNQQGLKILEIEIDGQRTREPARNVHMDRLRLDDVPDRFQLTVTSQIHPAENTSLEGLYKSGNILCTQCEAEGFRKIAPSLDRPDVLTRYRVRLEAPKEQFPVLLSNGNLIDQGDLGPDWHYTEWEDPFPKPTYLFAVVAGQLNCLEDRFTTMSGREVALRFFAEGNAIENCQFAMQSLKQAMRWDEDAWGREYDLHLYNVVAVRDFNMGAMENKSLNIFNTAYVLANPAFTTDRGFQLIREVIGHEYFHNWSGNRITLRDWFQLSLKEGFTVFREQEFSADTSSRGVRRIEAVCEMRDHQFSEDAGAMAHPVQPQSYQQIDNFYTATVYIKGAEVVRMLQTLAGRKSFREGVDLYFKKHDGQAVTINEFVNAIENASDHDLSQFMLWYSQAGTPLVHADFQYLPSESAVELKLAQSCPLTADGFDKKPFVIPIAAALFDESGKKVDIGPDSSETVLMLSKAEQTFRFENIPTPAVPSLLRGFSAPVLLQTNLSKEQLALLLNHDDDPFVRWDSGQQLYVQQLLADIKAIQAGSKPRPSSFLCQQMQQLISNRNIDHELLATLIELPSIEYLGCQMTKIDPEAIHLALCSMEQALALFCKEEMLNRYRECAAISRGQVNDIETGARALRDHCLHYLGALNDSEVWSLAADQLTQAQCMTDSIRALHVLIRTNHPEKSHFVDEFYDRWKHQPEVVDKWFSVQAGAPLPATLHRVEALTHHPGFKWKNPNNVRALIGHFCHGNPVIFHAENGSGYAFAAEWIKKLDGVNPSQSSSLAKAFENWRNYRPDLAALMQKTLVELNQGGLSKMTREIVSNSLEC